MGDRKLKRAAASSGPNVELAFTNGTLLCLFVRDGVQVPQKLACSEFKHKKQAIVQRWGSRYFYCPIHGIIGTAPAARNSSAFEACTKKALKGLYKSGFRVIGDERSPNMKTRFYRNTLHILDGDEGWMPVAEDVRVAYGYSDLDRVPAWITLVKEEL